MGYVILGHGSLNPLKSTKMEICALNAGTTLQFYADTGQALTVNKKLLDSFGSMEQPWPPIDSTGVTYNLSLSPLSDQQRARLVSPDQDLGGNALLLVGTNLGSKPQLCTGDERTCPKDPRMVTGAVAGPSKHNCDGILGVYGGQDLYWVACTATRGFDAETQGAVDAARGEAPKSVILGSDPDSAVASALKRAELDPAGFPAWFDGQPQEQRDVLLRDSGIYAWYQGRLATESQGTVWTPSEGDHGVVQQTNEAFVKDLDEDVAADWEIGAGLVLLGDQHGDYHNAVRTQQGYGYGTFQVERARIGAGKLRFSNVPPVHQATITEAVERFSDKSVKFE